MDGQAPFPGGDVVCFGGAKDAELQREGVLSISRLRLISWLDWSPSSLGQIAVAARTLSSTPANASKLLETSFTLRGILKYDTISIFDA